jgi:hypothetical protein
MVGLAYVGSALGGRLGRDIGIVAGVGITFFCIAGAADATWRSLLVYVARRRYKRQGTLDLRAARAMKLARLEYPTLVVQMIVGIAAAILAGVFL